MSRASLASEAQSRPDHHGSSSGFAVRLNATLARRLLNAVAWVAVCGAIVWIYAWMASGGTWRYSSASVPYAEMLADAFLAGQLSLLVEPRPELLALPDPYDQARSAPYRLPDASLFNGKYYLYFGPVPGLIHAAWKLTTGGRIEEGAMQLVAAVGGGFWFLLLVRRLRALAFPQLSSVWANAAAVCYALGGVGLYLVARTIGHHETILVGSFFVLGGYYLWLRGLEGGRLALAYLVAAGVFLGLAFGTRHIMIGYALGCGLVMVWLWLKAPRNRTAAVRMIAYAIGPSVCVILHLIYNHARFGAPVDFGINYQLNNLPTLNHASNFLGVLTLNNVWLNLQTYFAYVPTFIPLFPFYVPIHALPFLVLQSEPHPGWAFEGPMMAMPLVAPLTMLAPASLILLGRRWRPPSTQAPWFIVGAAAGLVIPAMVTVFQVWATARYLQDTLPLAAILGALGLWWLRSIAGSAIQRQAVRFLAAGILTLSIVMGGILGMSELSYDKDQAYVHLTYGFDRLVTGVLRVIRPSSWTSIYSSVSRTRLVWNLSAGPFYVEGAEFDLIAAPTDSALRSVRIASAYDEPIRLTVYSMGRQLLEEHVYPGTQTIFIEETFQIDAASSVPLQLRFPDLPPEPAGSLRRVSVYGGSSRPDYSIADSHLIMINNLRRQVEQSYEVIERMRADLDAATADVRATMDAINAGTARSDAQERLKEQQARVTALERDYKDMVMRMRQDEFRFRAEEQYIQGKSERANAARARQ